MCAYTLLYKPQRHIWFQFMKQTNRLTEKNILSDGSYCVCCPCADAASAPSPGARDDFIQGEANQKRENSKRDLLTLR